VPNIGLCIVGIIGIFTAVSTLRKIERQTAATEKNLIMQFRPKVIIRGGFVDGVGQVEQAAMEFVITNIGANIAHVEATTFAARLVDYSYGTCDLFAKSFSLPKMSLEPGEGHPHSFTMDKETTEALRIVDRSHRYGTEEKKTIVFAGTIKYRDDLGVLRRTGIFRKYSAVEQRFVPHTDSDYEYAD
jgi:hypothetical protein